MKYSELLFRAKPNYAFDYAKDAANNWDFDGFVFSLNTLKFDGTITFNLLINKILGM